MVLNWLGGEGTHYSGAGDHVAALRVAGQARALCDRYALHRMQAMVELEEAFAWMVGEAPGKAREVLDRLLASWGPTPRRDRPMFELASGLVASRMREFEKALEHARAMIASVERVGIPAFLVLGHLLAARALESGTDRDAFRSHLLAAREAGAAANMALADYVSSLAEARIALAADDRPSAAEWLRRAFSLGRDRGFVHHLWFSRAETEELCALALENDIEPDFARKLTARGSPEPQAAIARRS